MHPSTPFRLLRTSPSAMLGTRRLVLIDGNAILHRAYHALPPLTSRDGTLVNAVYGFWTMMLRVVQDLKPEFLAVAFDTEKPTFRHAAFVGYQAHRPRVESDLASQIGIVQETLKAAGIPVYFEPGYEADDIIGTLSRKFEIRTPKESSKKNSKLEIIIVTGDRDLFQLVGPKVKIYMPVKGLSEARLFDASEVEKYLGVAPGQVVDYKALIGDQSDNYPGVPGIGPKTATDLLKKHKTVKGIYEALKEGRLDAPEAVINKLSEGHESAMLSLELAQIRTDVPVTFNIEEMKLKPLAGNQGLIEKMREIGFKSLINRLEQRPAPLAGRTKNKEHRAKGKVGSKTDQLKLV